jgi:hypothetical protein
MPSRRIGRWGLWTNSGVNPCEVAHWSFGSAVLNATACAEKLPGSVSTCPSATRRIGHLIYKQFTILHRTASTKGSHAAAATCAWTRYHQNRPPMNRPTRT